MPAFVSVGDLCGANFGSGTSAASLAKNQYNYNAGTSAAIGELPEDPALYASGQTSTYCTGDSSTRRTTAAGHDVTRSASRWRHRTRGTRRATRSSSTCIKTFKGFSGDLYTALNQYKQDASGSRAVHHRSRRSRRGGYQPTGRVRRSGSGRRCARSTAPCPQARTSSRCRATRADDNSAGNGHNRFALRAFGSSPSDNAATSRSAATPTWPSTPTCRARNTSFYLTQVSPAAAGQVLNVRLCDIGDSSQPGTVTIRPPADSNLSSFTGCVAAGPTTGTLSSCSIPANSSYNGKWEQVSIPIPAQLHLRLDGGHRLLDHAVVQLRQRPAVGHHVLDGQPRRHARPHHGMTATG